MLDRRIELAINMHRHGHVALSGVLVNKIRPQCQVSLLADCRVDGEKRQELCCGRKTRQELGYDREKKWKTIRATTGKQHG